MDRSFAGRPGIGRLTRPPRPAARRRAGRSRAARGGPRRIDLALEHLGRPIAAAAALLRGGLSFAWRRRRLRVALLALLIGSPLLTGGWLWLRNSSLVSVQHVRVSGVHGPDARAIDAALTAAGRRMSTLNVHTAGLRAAVAPYRVVRDLRVTSSFPHGLSIRVLEQLPVAALTVAGTRTAVAADGVVLGPALLSPSLPAIAQAGAPAAGGRVRDAALLAALSALGAAPAPLAKLVERTFTGPKGLTVVMRGGLLAYFGDGSRPHAKWLSLARVLADPSSAGASYVDLRLPERPAAGFPAGVAPPASTSSEAGSAPATQAGSESPEALAERLSAAVGGHASAGSSSTEPENAKPSERSSSSTGEASAGAGSEAPGSTPAPGG